MTPEFSLTIGPATTVEYVLHAHPEQKLLYFKSTDIKDRYMLLDVFDAHRVFSADLRFTTFYDNGEDDQSWAGSFYEVRYVTLNKDEQKVFTALLNNWKNLEMRPKGLMRTLVGFKPKHTFEYIIINVWENEEDFTSWFDAKDNSLRQFTYEGGPGSLVRTYDHLTKSEIEKGAHAIIVSHKKQERAAYEQAADLDWNKSWNKGWD